VVDDFGRGNEQNRRFFHTRCAVAGGSSLFRTDVDAYFDIDAALAHLGDFYALPEDIIRTKKARLAKQAEIEEQVKASQKEEERLAMMEKMDPQRQSAPGSYAARRGF